MAFSQARQNGRAYEIPKIRYAKNGRAYEIPKIRYPPKHAYICIYERAYETLEYGILTSTPKWACL